MESMQKLLAADHDPSETQDIYGFHSMDAINYISEQSGTNLQDLRVATFYSQFR